MFCPQTGDVFAIGLIALFFLLLLRTRLIRSEENKRITDAQFQGTRKAIGSAAVVSVVVAHRLANSRSCCSICYRTAFPSTDLASSSRQYRYPGGDIYGGKDGHGFGRVACALHEYYYKPSLTPCRTLYPIIDTCTPRSTPSGLYHSPIGLAFQISMMQTLLFERGDDEICISICEVPCRVGGSGQFNGGISCGGSSIF